LLKGRRPGGGEAWSRQQSPGRIYKVMVNFIVRFVRDEEGQDLVEYAMLLAFIALVCITAVKLLGTNVNSFFNNMATQLNP
jgi:pilus assembly protein Flp/PilA